VVDNLDAILAASRDDVVADEDLQRLLLRLVQYFT